MPIQLNPGLPVITARFITRLRIHNKILAEGGRRTTYARGPARTLGDRCIELVAQTVIEHETIGDLPCVLKPRSALVAIDGRWSNMFAIGEVRRSQRARVGKWAAAQKAGEC